MPMKISLEQLVAEGRNEEGSGEGTPPVITFVNPLAGFPWPAYKTAEEDQAERADALVRFLRLQADETHRAQERLRQRVKVNVHQRQVRQFHTK